MHMFRNSNSWFVKRIDMKIEYITKKKTNDSSWRYLREINIHILSLTSTIQAQTTPPAVTATRQLNKAVCDKTRNTLVFYFSGKKEEEEEEKNTYVSIHMLKSISQCRTVREIEGHQNFRLLKIYSFTFDFHGDNPFRI